MHKSTYRDPILSWWTSVAKLPSFFKNFQTVWRLRVNETKLTLRNVFISDHVALGGEKELKFGERTPFRGSLQKLDLSVNS